MKGSSFYDPNRVRDQACKPSSVEYGNLSCSPVARGLQPPFRSLSAGPALGQSPIENTNRRCIG